MNGFSTHYWNWGYEDLDFLLRAEFNKVTVNRSNFEERFKSSLFLELDEQDESDLRRKMELQSTKINETNFSYSLLHPNILKTIGLNSTEYKVWGASQNVAYLKQ